MRLSQVEAFSSYRRVHGTGDGQSSTARRGAASWWPWPKKHKLPVHFIGVGEAIDDSRSLHRAEILQTRLRELSRPQSFETRLRPPPQDEGEANRNAPHPEEARKRRLEGWDATTKMD